MKSKSVSGISRHPKELTFAWGRGDQALIRFWFALFLATGILVAIWCSVRIVVPAAMAPDRPRVDRAQLIVVNEKSHPSLKLLLSDRNLPSLGEEDGIANAPMLEGMLSLLGLEEEEKGAIDLYPEPLVEPSLEWPEREQSAFTLPALPEVMEDSWPQLEESSNLEWVVTLKGRGALSEVFHEQVLLRTETVPAIRTLLWSVALDRDGKLAFAGAVEEVNPQVEEEIRRALQRLFDERPAEGGVSGLVELNFSKKKD